MFGDTLGDSHGVSLEMYLEGVINRVWRYTLGGFIEQDWIYPWRRLMDGTMAAETLLIS